MVCNDETDDAFDDASSWHDEGKEEEGESKKMVSYERRVSSDFLQHPHKVQPEHCNHEPARTAGSLQSLSLEDYDLTDRKSPGHLDAVADAPPPTSALVTRVFGAARATSSTSSDAGLNQGHAGERVGNRQGRGREGRRHDTDRVQKIRKQEAMLQAQIEQVELETQKIARDRAALSQQRVALDQREEAFKQRQDETLLKIEQERREFDTYKTDEIRKMKRDCRNQERNAVRSAAQLANEKRLRADLQAQVEALQAAAQANEARGRLQEGRLRSQIDELKKRNSELEGDLAFHEQQRLTRWKAEELGTVRPSAGHADQAYHQDDPAKSVLKGIDTRLRDSMERSRGIAEELQQQTWESGGSSIRAVVSDEDGQLAVHEQPCDGQNDESCQQNSQHQHKHKHKHKQQHKPARPPTIPSEDSRLSTLDAAAATGNNLNRTSRTRVNTSTVIGSTHRSDPKSDPHVRGRARQAQDIDQQCSPQLALATNVSSGPQTAVQAGQVTEQHDDFASIEREWNLLIERMPPLTPIGAIAPRPPALIFEQHHPDGKHEQVSSSCHVMCSPHGYYAGIAASRSSRFNP
jgi:hypothetical protein